MRNFTIYFDYSDHLLSAKIQLKKTGNIVLQSITLLENSMEVILDINQLLLMQTKSGMQLVILHDNNTIEPLPWSVKNEADDYVEMMNPSVFCLS